jgi:hypothetical protein
MTKTPMTTTESWMRPRMPPGREADVEAEGHVGHDEDDGDGDGLDGRVAELLAGLGADPLDAQGGLRRDVGAELLAQAVHQQVTLRLERHLDLEVAGADQQRVLLAAAQLDVAHGLHLLADLVQVGLLS